MGASKTESFTIEQNELATLAKALGHPARIAIIEYLLKVQTCICGDIVMELPLAQPTVSQHLKELKKVLKEPQFVTASMRRASKKLKVFFNASPNI
jgi:DNA-binding transcriptional ArsR family regulator